MEAVTLTVVLSTLVGFVAGVVAVWLRRRLIGPQPSPEYLKHVEAEEHATDLYQQLGQLKVKVDTMTKHRSEGGINALSLQVAREIEDQFAQHHSGGRGQRLAKTQVIVRESIREALTGERKWDAWRSGSTLSPPKTIESETRK